MEKEAREWKFVWEYWTIARKWKGGNRKKM